ncbi:MAG: hypothetical protein WAV31_01225 [Candidatus Moraniibacteriota bacterium]
MENVRNLLEKLCFSKTKNPKQEIRDKTEDNSMLYCPDWVLDPKNLGEEIYIKFRGESLSKFLIGTTPLVVGFKENGVNVAACQICAENTDPRIPNTAHVWFCERFINEDDAVDYILKANGSFVGPLYSPHFPAP